MLIIWGEISSAEAQFGAQVHKHLVWVSNQKEKLREKKTVDALLKLLNLRMQIEVQIQSTLRVTKLRKFQQMINQKGKGKKKKTKVTSQQTFLFCFF